MVDATNPRFLAGKRVLVLEDDYIVALDLADILETAGATVIGPVGNTEAAFALLKLEDERPYLAVLDVNLAGARSYSVADTLIELGVPFIFVTGYGASSIHVAYSSHPRIEKPLDDQALLVALLALL